MIPYAIRSRLKSALQCLFYQTLRIIGNVLFPIFGAQMPLRGYCSRTEAVCSRYGGYFIRLDQAHAVRAVARPPSCGDLIGLSSVSSFITPDTFVGIIPRGRVVHNYGIVLSPDHKLLADVSPPIAGDPETHPVLFELFLPPVRNLLGHVAVVTSQAHQRYFHWLFDILPRFELLRRSNVHIDQYVVNTELSFQRESLEILGIPTEKIISPRWATHIEAEALIVPSLPGQLGVMTPRSCEFLRTIFLPIKHQKPIAGRLIYITRRRALTRRVLNEHELLDRMSRYDVDAIELEGMSIAQQAELFANARLILAPHGAGIANAVFCSESSALIELMPDTYNSPCFEILAGLRSLRYVRIPTHSTSLVTHDQYVNIVKVEAIVEEMLGSRG
jgi:Glycosyltransferase 61